jgi:hypothetical protein
MTDLDRFIIQFEVHVEEIYNHNDIGLLHLGMYEHGPVKVYSKIYEDYIYEYTELATKEVIQKLEIISFIEITDDPSISTLSYSPILAKNFLGIRCLYEEINYYPVFTHMEMESNNYIHAAAIYECMKRIILKCKPQQEKEYSQKRNDNINIIQNAMEVFEKWAINEGIAIESNIYRTSISQKKFNPIGDYSLLYIYKLKKTFKIGAKDVRRFIKHVFENYQGGKEFSGCDVCTELRSIYNISKIDNKKEKPFTETSYSRLFHNARGDYEIIKNELFRPIKKNGKVKLRWHQITPEYQNK